MAVLVMLVGCGPSHRLTWRLDTNQNEFRLYPLDVKEPSPEGDVPKDTETGETEGAETETQPTEPTE